MKRRAAISAVLLLFLVTACGAESDAASVSEGDPQVSTDPSSSSGVIAGVGPGLTIAEARTTDADGPLLVRGALVVDAGSARLCERLAESSPPQCGGDSFDLVGLDPSTVDGIEETDGVQWAEQVRLLGALEGDRFVLTDTAAG